MYEEKIFWYSPQEKLPEYQAQVRGNAFVPVLVKVKGDVWAGLYENEKFKIDGDVEVEPELWAYYPKGE